MQRAAIARALIARPRSGPTSSWRAATAAASASAFPAISRMADSRGP